MCMDKWYRAYQPHRDSQPARRARARTRAVQHQRHCSEISRPQSLLNSVRPRRARARNMRLFVARTITVFVICGIYIHIAYTTVYNTERAAYSMKNLSAPAACCVVFPVAPAECRLRAGAAGARAKQTQTFGGRARHHGTVKQHRRRRRRGDDGLCVRAHVCRIRR